MANDKMTFTLGVKTTADLDGINKLKSALKELNNEVSDSDSSLSEERLGFNAKKINEASVAINALSKALNSSFDSALGGINFNKFQQSIKESGFSMQELQRRMAMLGSEGYTAFEFCLIFLSLSKSPLSMASFNRFPSLSYCPTVQL